MITTYSFQADFRHVAQRLAKEKRQRVQHTERVRRPARTASEEHEGIRFHNEDASNERVA